MMMHEQQSDHEWFQAWLDTPIAFPGARNPTEAMRRPGCCLKSHAMDGPWPARFGVLVAYDEVINDGKGHVVVRSQETGRAEPRRVWSGTVASYLADWQCD